MRNETYHMPPMIRNGDGKIRRVGFELEFSGIELPRCASLLSRALSGKPKALNPYHYKIEKTPLGDFSVVLDFQFLIDSGLQKWLHAVGLDQALEPDTVAAIERFIAELSERVVPYEVTSPPLPLTKLATMDRVVDTLRRAGAQGTGADPLYAFGLHVNPEAARLDAVYLVSVLRAFFVLYDYLVELLKPDTTRRLTPYIDPFDEAYVHRVLDEGYAPTMVGFIEDYLKANPTRNRALDLLPLLAHIDLNLVTARLEDEKISPRPAWHYRLPNSRVNEPNWSVAEAWNSWVLVERLAADKEALAKLSVGYRAYLETPFRFLAKNRWIKTVAAWAEGSS